MVNKKKFEKSEEVKKLGAIPSLAQIAHEKLSDKQALQSAGLVNDALFESYPILIESKGQKVIAGPNNSAVRLGRDQPGNRESGYGGKGQAKCGMIDLICGLGGWKGRGVNAAGERMYANPSFALDAARIYMSQKTDIDKNMGLAKGTVGDSIGKSAIGVKADAVRIVGREGIKLVTGPNGKNSIGEDNVYIRGVDILAWNNEKELQPMVKGANLETCLRSLVDRIDELSGMVDTLLMTQMKFNTAITTHTHISPFFGSPTTPSPNLMQPGIKCSLDQLLDTKMSLVMNKFNLQQMKVQFLSPAAKRYINSRWNNVN